jgi:peptidoglycan/LPS O-acetylase OafA/YrhL
MNESRIDAIDGWRAVSVAMVIAGHLFAYSSIKADAPVADILFALGRLGVQVFFVISGFVIARGFISEAASSGRISLPGFYIRRALRILPPLMLYLVAVVGLAYSGIYPHWSIDLLRPLTFTCNFDQSGCGGPLGTHLWSLSVEEQFYLVIPFLFCAFGKRRFVLTVGILCFPLFVLFLYALKYTTTAGLLWNFISIAIGVACALNEEHLLRLCAKTPKGIALAAGAAVVTVWLLPSTPLTTIIKTVSVAPLIALTLLGTSKSDFLSSAPMRYIGRISYSIYLWQQIATFAFPGAGPVFYGCSIGLTIVVAAASYRWVERPLISWGRVSWGRALSIRLEERRTALPSPAARRSVFASR